jgi:putative DNA methylase
LKEQVKTRKKLIEVALPLEAINIESLRRKQKAPKGYPTSFHKWWAQRPLAACRAVLFASLVDDPSEHPEVFPTVEDQASERERLLALMRELIKWENYQDELLHKSAWREITRYSKNPPPILYDPFAGGGSIPLEGQRLGLTSFASDLNPVSVLINKAMLEIPNKFVRREPINPDWQRKTVQEKAIRHWSGCQGLAEDVRYYGRWLHKEAQKRIGHLYTAVEVTAEMVVLRPDLKQYLGKHLKVIAWLWARSVRSPSPAFPDVEVPLAATFVISTKSGKEAYVEPVVEDNRYRFEVRCGKPPASKSSHPGTTMGKRAAFRCLVSGDALTYDYIRQEGQAGRMGTKLMAIVVEGKGGRVYLSPTPEAEALAKAAHPTWIPDNVLPKNPRDFKTPLYGMRTFGSLFTDRQLQALTTFSDLVVAARNVALEDAKNAGMQDDGVSLEEGGKAANAFADAVAVYLGCAVDRMVYYGSSLTTWLPKDNALRDCMPRQALAMTWDFAECNPLAKSSGDIDTCINSVANFLDVAEPRAEARVFQRDAAIGLDTGEFLFSTDPPYYDNISYADLSEYFYVWLRRSLKSIVPKLFSRLEVPKAEELVASPYRHGGGENAAKFFMDGMSRAMTAIGKRANPEFPITIYYAFKQAESDNENGVSSSGWETFLEAVIRAGFAINGTWPIRTEGAGRMLASGTNALGSSIVLVCRPRSISAAIATRREFLEALKAELPSALAVLQAGNILPVDLAQAAIGPGMAVYTRYGKVIDAEGNQVTVAQAFSMINRVLDEVLAEQEGDFDVDTRWALAWFEQFGFDEGPYGTAEILSKAKNTSVVGMVEAGVVASKSGKVRLLRPDELSAEWDPSTDSRLNVWETVHHLIRVLGQGETFAAELVTRLGPIAEVARELVYRLDNICKNQNRSQERLAYNALVQSWPEITRLARQSGQQSVVQTQSNLFAEKA